MGKNIVVIWCNFQKKQKKTPPNLNTIKHRCRTFPELRAGFPKFSTKDRETLVMICSFLLEDRADIQVINGYKIKYRKFSLCY